jgi:hypothetical protein
MGITLKDRNLQIGRLTLELKRRREASKATAKNEDITCGGGRLRVARERLIRFHIVES